MEEFEFKIIGVEKGTWKLTSENGDDWDVESLPDVPDYVLHENDFYTKDQVREILIKFANSKNAMRRDMTAEKIVDEFINNN